MQGLDIPVHVYYSWEVDGQCADLINTHGRLASMLEHDIDYKQETHYAGGNIAEVTAPLTSIPIPSGLLAAVDGRRPDVVKRLTAEPIVEEREFPTDEEEEEDDADYDWDSPDRPSGDGTGASSIA